MGHCVYTGSFAALETRWMEVIAELQRGDPLRPANVLIGSNVLASYLKRRLAGRRRAFANVRFHTFLDLTNHLAASERVQKPRLPRLGASIILQEILSAHAPDIYAPISGYRGFRDALLDTFRDLRDAGLGWRELDAAIKSRRDLSPDREDHLLSLAELYRRFRERMELFHGVDDDFRAAVIRASDPEKSHGFKELLVYGIYDVTGQQAELLSALKHHADMIYFIPYVDETVTEFARPFLEARLEELGVSRVHLAAPNPANSLDAWAARGFGFAGPTRSENAATDSPAASLAPDSSFALVSAPGESRAAAEIVREIFRSVRDGVIAGFHEAAVILRQSEIDVPILAETFRLRGIPCFIHGGSSFSDRPLSKAIIAMAALEDASYSREAVLTAMELTAAALPKVSAAAWNVQEWRVLTNVPEFLAGLDSWDAGIDALIENARKELRKAAAREPAAEDEDIGRSANSIPLAGKRLELAKSLQAGWQSLRHAGAGWPAALSWKEWAQFLEQRFEPIFGDSEDWHSFSAVLDEIGGLQNVTQVARLNPQVPRDRMVAALVESMSSLSHPEGRFERSGVNIISTSAARGLRFPLVIISGLEEGRFPARLRQDPLLLDGERRQLKGLPIKSERAKEEKLLFDMAARSAEKRLVLMTSRLDESSDRERIPSQFFLRAAAAVRGRAVSLRDMMEGSIPGFRSVSLENPAPEEGEIAIDEGEIRLRLITAGRAESHAALSALAGLEPLRLERALAFDRARWMKKLTEFDGRLADPKLIQYVAGSVGSAAGQVSASRLEEYAKCPYFFFLKRVMNLEAWEEQEPTEGMDPLERGLAVHAILESFLKDFCGEKFLETSVEDLQRLLEQRALENLERSRPAGMPDLLWEIEREGLLEMLGNWLKFEKERSTAGMIPFQLEQLFGEFSPEERFPAFQVQAGRHLFSFRGRIDRVDVSRNGKHALVIDYKTGTLPESMTRVARSPLMSGEKIQVAVYRGALSVLEEFAGVETAEGEYLHLQPKDGRIVPCSFTEEEMQQASVELPRILKMIGNGIESGLFHIRTKGTVWPNGHCDFCDFLPICGKDRIQREERKMY